VYEAEQPTSGPQRTLNVALRLAREYDKIVVAIKLLRSQAAENVKRNRLQLRASRLIPPQIVTGVLSELGANPEKRTALDVLTGELPVREIALVVLRHKEGARNNWLGQTTIEEYISWARSFLKEWDLLPK
jgi:hypothetical protein